MRMHVSAERTNVHPTSKHVMQVREKVGEEMCVHEQEKKYVCVKDANAHEAVKYFRP